MIRDLKQSLVNRLKRVGAYAVGIADPRVGYEKTLHRKHPLELWEQCRSVIVFAVACSPKANNTYTGLYAPWSQPNRGIGPVPEYIQSECYAMDRLYRPFLSSITLRGMEFLHTNGCTFSFLKPQLKLSAFEAGLGVYGRSGLIIHPILGNRIRLGAIMTDVVLEPDGRLEGYSPCENCDLCIKMCPAKAHDPKKRYHQSFDREKCLSKRAEIAEKGLYCHNCYAVCHVGKLKDEELLCMKDANSIFKHEVNVR